VAEDFTEMTNDTTELMVIFLLLMALTSLGPAVLYSNGNIWMSCQWISNFTMIGLIKLSHSPVREIEKVLIQFLLCSYISRC
jgi:hypothetical protein